MIESDSACTHVRIVIVVVGLKFTYAHTQKDTDTDAHTHTHAHAVEMSARKLIFPIDLVVFKLAATAPRLRPQLLPLLASQSLQLQRPSPQQSLPPFPPFRHLLVPIS